MNETSTHVHLRAGHTELHTSGLNFVKRTDPFEENIHSCSNVLFGTAAQQFQPNCSFPHRDVRMTVSMVYRILMEEVIVFHYDSVLLFQHCWICTCTKSTHYSPSARKLRHYCLSCRFLHRKWRIYIIRELYPFIMQFCLHEKLELVSTICFWASFWKNVIDSILFRFQFEVCFRHRLMSVNKLFLRQMSRAVTRGVQNRLRASCSTLHLLSSRILAINSNSSWSLMMVISSQSA